MVEWRHPRSFHDTHEAVGALGSLARNHAFVRNQDEASAEMDFGAAVCAKAISALRSVMRYWLIGAMLGI